MSVSSLSVVASVVSRLSVNGMAPTTVRPLYVSLLGGAASAVPADVIRVPSTSADTAALRRCLMMPLLAGCWRAQLGARNWTLSPAVVARQTRSLLRPRAAPASSPGRPPSTGAPLYRY